MIKSLRIKFICVSMGVVLAVFAVMFVMLNIFMRDSNARETDKLLGMIAATDGMSMKVRRQHNGQPIGGELPAEMGGEANSFWSTAPGGSYNPSIVYSAESESDMPIHVVTPIVITREDFAGGKFFYAKLDGESNVMELNIDMMFDFTEEEAKEYIRRVPKSGETGLVDSLRYRYVEKDYGGILVFAETTQAAGMLRRLINISVWVALGSFLVLFALSIPLSKWVSAPVETAFIKQRRFVSDAGHELRTPLTILSASADVLEGEIGENEWLNRIKEQTSRMGMLIHDLLTLAKTEESGLTLSRLDWSSSVLSAALEYESRAFEEGKSLTLDVPEGIFAKGDQQHIRQVVGILLDNAIKHSTGEVSVSLKEEAGKVRLCVFNTGMGVAEDEKERIFERFYRSDSSRSRDTGGYGLGLSIAKAMVEALKGKISLEGEHGKWVRFIVEVDA